MKTNKTPFRRYITLEEALEMKVLLSEYDIIAEVKKENPNAIVLIDSMKPQVHHLNLKEEDFDKAEEILIDISNSTDLNEHHLNKLDNVEIVEMYKNKYDLNIEEVIILDRIIKEREINIDYEEIEKNAPENKTEEELKQTNLLTLMSLGATALAIAFIALLKAPYFTYAFLFFAGGIGVNYYFFHSKGKENTKIYKYNKQARLLGLAIIILNVSILLTYIILTFFFGFQTITI